MEDRRDKKEKKEKKERKEKKEKKRRRHGTDSESGGGSDLDEEERLARANRKAGKRAEKVAKMLGYSNETNPFGDSNLLQPFVWGKKQEKDLREGRGDSGKDAEVQRLKTMEEIERARKRREDREKEKEEMERLRTEEQRLRDSAQFGDWQTKEEDFHMEQTRERSKIRISEAREQPIDTIAKNILLIEQHLDGGGGGGGTATAAAARGEKNKSTTYDLVGLQCELRDPARIVHGLGVPELEKLLVDIDAYVQLEARKSGPYQLFWQSLFVVAEAELRAQRQHQLAGGQDASSVHKSVSEDVKKLLRGKVAEDLAELEGEIHRGLQDGSYSDVAYWSNALEAVKVQKARLVVTDTHHQLLQKQLEALSRIRELAEMQRSGEGAASATEAAAAVPLAADNDDEGYQREFGESEEKMQSNDEVALPPLASHSWQDKIRPRKPKYFNHVRTGWDWNKYNQSHYDMDNPPPRTVHGYKFNIFYPDLIDKSATPKFFLEAADSPDFAILRFHAGPPYEDVAFKILNKEWEHARKSGFRSVFNRGVLQLHFNFKRRFYRR